MVTACRQGVLQCARCLLNCVWQAYNQKKEKYDRIKETEYDIDDELIQAKERLHENIAQRIKYFEEKDELTNREIQELRNLKEPENWKKENYW